MKILKEISRKYKGKKYYKYKINLPVGLLKMAKFEAGDNLKAEVKKHEVRLKKSTK